MLLLLEKLQRGLKVTISGEYEKAVWLVVGF